MKKYLCKPLDLENYDTLDIGLIWWSRPRILLKNKKNNHIYILKSYTKTPRELWVEQFASNLWKKIPNITTVQEVTPKILWEDVVQKLNNQLTLQATLTDIAVLIRHAFPAWYETWYGYQILWLEPRDIPELDLVYEKITSRYRWYGKDKKILQSYADMLVFDALIGNMDRHLENWGVHESKVLFLPSEKERIPELVQFTTLFDHWSAGLFEISESKIDDYLQHKESFYKEYILKSWYSLVTIQWKNKSIFEILNILYQDKNWMKIVKISIQKIQKLAYMDIAEIIFKMPNDPKFEYSKNRQELLFQSIILRKNELEKIIT